MVKFSPVWVLRVTLSLTYFYSGWSLFREPADWFWAVPSWFDSFVASFGPIEIFLKLQGVIEIMFGLVFLAWFLPRKVAKYAALLAALQMLAILVFAGVDLITFRDIGVFGGLFSLYLLLLRSEEKDSAQ